MPAKFQHSEKLFEIQIMHELMSIAENGALHITDSILEVAARNDENNSFIEMLKSVRREFSGNLRMHADNIRLENKHGIDAGFADYTQSEFVLGIQFKAGNFHEYAKRKRTNKTSSKFHKSKDKDTGHFLFKLIGSSSDTQFKTIYDFNKGSDSSSHEIIHYCFPRIDYPKNKGVEYPFLKNSSFKKTSDLYNQIKRSWESHIINDPEVNRDELSDYVFNRQHNVRISANIPNLWEVNYYYYSYYYYIPIDIPTELFILQLQKILSTIKLFAGNNLDFITTFVNYIYKIDVQLFDVIFPLLNHLSLNKLGDSMVDNILLYKFHWLTPIEVFRKAVAESGNNVPDSLYLFLQ